MIDTLVVDDDFRVARAHATAVDRIAGFRCVGTAHTAAEARRSIAELHPQFMLLDIYLPDEDGLSLLRGLRASSDAAPDALVITAARDLDTVRAAMRNGALYYLVKPFGLTQLREQLEAYRRWYEQLHSATRAGAADQATVDELYRLLRSATPSRPGRQLAPTMRGVLDSVRNADGPVSAAEVSNRLGISRPTAQRYLSELEQRGVLELVLDYGSTGRPSHLYRLSRDRV